MATKKITLGHMFRELNSFLPCSQYFEAADQSDITNHNNSDFAGAVNDWINGIYDEYPDYLLQTLVKVLDGSKINIKEIDIRENVLNNRSGEKNRLSPKLYVFIKDESILENLTNRRNRPYTEYKKTILPKVMETIEKSNPRLFERIKDKVWSWDKHCGCSACPCSPGFVMRNIIQPVDIYVTI
jgi:hypothetical protein